MAAARRIRATLAVLVAAGSASWFACADQGPDSGLGPQGPGSHPLLEHAIAAQERHTLQLLEIPGVIGTAVTTLADGRVGVQILLERDGVEVPQELDGVPVRRWVTGRIMAFSDPKTRRRPAPLGYSVGHFAITAGTIGARVRDAQGRVYILSNNHVLANSNGAAIGDPAYQPGPFDGGTSADQIATLSEFQTITFTSTANNTMDAAIALSSTSVLDNTTPTDEAYGMPGSRIYGDGNGDGMFDDRDALLGLYVQKYGRTTRLTHGQITGVNATVTICYEVSGIFCIKSGRFVDQLIISPGGFSDGGDSGSLIVTDDANASPVALLFAGSATMTIANRIDLVLNRFGVTIDGLDPPPPGPFTDLAVMSVTVPAHVVVNVANTVTVSVRNMGNQDVTQPFGVNLQDVTTGTSVGSQTVAGLAAGQTTVASFQWTPSTLGEHTLQATHTLTDDRAINNQSATSVQVEAPLTDIAVTAVTAPPAVNEGHTINVNVTVANVGNQLVADTVVVTLRDQTDNTVVGTQTVVGLSVGASVNVTFPFNATGASLGSHTLMASHSRTDDDATNDARAVVVKVNPRLSDVAMTSIAGPAQVNQGDTAHIMVTVQNVGEVDVGSFDVVLTDGTAGGIVLATRTVTSLAVGAGATLDLPWNTAGASTTGHTLIATVALQDGVSTNNARAIGITVKAPVSLVTDVSITALNAPASITEGNTAGITVTVQNVGQEAVGSPFTVTLTDSTSGATIGTQTVSALAVGAATTLSFSWNTTGQSVGTHVLVATHSLADPTPVNNRRTAPVNITPKQSDVALTSITGPASVNQGDTAHFMVTVQNVGQQDVTVPFQVVVNDATAGGTVGAQTVNGLALGASVTLDFPWNTAGVAVTGHTMIATQLLPDANSSNNARAIGITVKPAVTQVTDVAVNAVTAPTAVNQGQPATVMVAIGNAGNVAVTTSFVVTLQDATAGTTIGSQTVSSVALSGSATLTFTWSTTGAVLGTHTLTASHNLVDANAANNQRSATVTVNPQLLDVSVASISAPASVGQGNSATINVTVQNAGQLDAGPFNVTLTDQTGGAAIGSQPVAALTVGASTTLSFTWTTTTAALGNHTLVAAHTLADGVASNNQRSVVVAVNPRVVDLSLASLTGPASVTQGDTARFIVVVQNVGGQDVITPFDVVLADGAVTLGTQTQTGLATGASIALEFPWNTAGAATVGHTIIARHTLADNNATNNSRAVGITVNAPSVHVGNMTASATNNGTSWTASVEVLAHDSRHAAVAGVVVRGGWGGSVTGECTTNEIGTCTIVYAGIPITTSLVSFAASSMTATGYVYKSASNHDPDGSSNGTTVFVRRP